MDSILIVAGENSGEKYGADLVHQFKKLHPSLSFFGIGGKHMEREGVRLLFPVEKLAVFGVFEVISHLPRIKKIFNRIKREARQVWVWRRGRLKTIKKTVDKMMLIFPFEEKIYEDYGIQAAYVGHPLKDRVRASLTKDAFLEKYRLDPEKKLISLLPGSRLSELKHHMPVLAKAMERIKSERDTQFVLLLAETIDEDFLLSLIPPWLKGLKILGEDHYEAIASSDLILSACGTANLEAALLETPLVSFYYLSPLTYFFIHRLGTIKNFSIVNILAGERIIPELIQRDFTAQNILEETKKILDSEEKRSEMITQFRRIKILLGEKTAPQNAAQELEKLIKQKQDTGKRQLEGK